MWLPYLIWAGGASYVRHTHFKATLTVATSGSCNEVLSRAYCLSLHPSFLSHCYPWAATAKGGAGGGSAGVKGATRITRTSGTTGTKGSERNERGEGEDGRHRAARCNG